MGRPSGTETTMSVTAIMMVWSTWATRGIQSESSKPGCIVNMAMRPTTMRAAKA